VNDERNGIASQDKKLHPSGRAQDKNLHDFNGAARRPGIQGRAAEIVSALPGKAPTSGALQSHPGSDSEETGKTETTRIESRNVGSLLVKTDLSREIFR